MPIHARFALPLVSRVMGERRQNGDVVPPSFEMLSETCCIWADAERLRSVVMAENQQTHRWRPASGRLKSANPVRTDTNPAFAAGLLRDSPVR